MAIILIPTDQPDITAAIVAANNGDEIVLEESGSPFTGANNKNLNLGGLDPLTIKGEDDKYIVVDLENSGQFMTFNNGESLNVIVENLHIKNGNMSPHLNGGAFELLNNSNPLLRNLLITDCQARLGGAICFNGCTTAQVRNCTIENCLAVGWGGALYSGNSSTSFVYDTVIWNNDCTGGAGRGDQVDSQSTRITFTNCDIENAVPDDIVGTVTLTACIYTDPLFVTGDNGDYYLSHIATGQGADSPCIDGGSDTAENLGMDDKTTRTDSVADGGPLVDIGWHYPITYIAPTADASASPSSATLRCKDNGASVQFTDLSTGDVTSWLWDFGDGETSTEQNPLHAYQNAGTYTVTLTATGPAGSDSTTLTITITDEDRNTTTHYCIPYYKG